MHLRSLTIFTLVATAALAQSTLSQTIIQTPPGQVRQVLTQHQPELNESVFNDLVKAAAAAPNLTEAIRRAHLADDVDGVISGRAARGKGETQLAGWLLKQGRTKDAETVAQDLLKTHPNGVRGHALLGRLYIAEGRGPEAVTELQTAVKGAPQVASIHMALAKAYQLSGRQADARSEYQVAKSLGTSRDADEAPAKGDDHFDKAEAAFKAKDYQTAADEYGKALADDPKDVKAAIYQGDAYNHLGKTDEAIQCFKKAVAIDPNDCSAHRFLADAYEGVYDDTKDKQYLDQALAEFQLAAKIDPAKASKDLDRVNQKESQAQ